MIINQWPPIHALDKKPIEMLCRLDVNYLKRKELRFESADYCL